MKLAVGLGNPGTEYAETRHNVGFQVIERVAEALRIEIGTARFGSAFGKGRIGPDAVALLKPMTFMNRSGECVRAAASELDVEPRDLVVAYDEVDLPLGKLKVGVGGGDAGHRGIQSIVSELGTGDFTRVRVGIGRPAPRGDVKDWVLSPFEAQETELRDQALVRAAQAVEAVLRRGVAAAMNEFNRRA